MQTAPPARTRARARFLPAAGALAAAYLVIVPVLWLNRGVVDRGPISFPQPALASPLLPGQSPPQVERACVRAGRPARR